MIMEEKAEFTNEETRLIAMWFVPRLQFMIRNTTPGIGIDIELCARIVRNELRLEGWHDETIAAFNWMTNWQEIVGEVNK